MALMTGARCAAAVVMLMGLAACGGRAANPLEEQTVLDPLLDCVQLAAQRNFIERRIEELREERNDNRARTLSRVPGALIGSPVSAIVLADLSTAIYEEIEAAEARDARLAALQDEKGCFAAPAEPAAPESVDDEILGMTTENFETLIEGVAQPADLESEVAATQEVIDPKE